MDQTKERQLTEGVIWKQILLFSLPLLGSALIQQLYNTVDLLFAGNMLGTDATAAVGASSLLISCIVNFFTGVSVGISVIASQKVGAGEWKEVDRIIHTAMGISLAGGAILMVGGLIISKPVLLLMNTPDEILGPSVTYVRIYMLSMIPLVTFNMNAGIIRSFGNSRTPMMIQLAGGIANVLADYLSIRVFHLGVAGIAWATMISQGLAAVLSVLFLMRQTGECRLRWRDVTISGDILKLVLRIGVPAGLQSLVITISNVIVQSQINGFGVNTIAAFSAFFKIELLIYEPILSFGQAMMTFAGQNKGANKPKRITRGLRVTIGMGVIYALAMGLLLLRFGHFAFRLFTQDNDVIECGLQIIRVTFPLYWIYVFLEVTANTIRGVGRSIPPMIMVLMGQCVCRTVVLFLFTHIWGTITSVALVYPIGWAASAVSLILYWMHMKKNELQL